MLFGEGVMFVCFVFKDKDGDCVIYYVVFGDEFGVVEQLIKVGSDMNV